MDVMATEKEQRVIDLARQAVQDQPEGESDPLIHSFFAGEYGEVNAYLCRFCMEDRYWHYPEHDPECLGLKLIAALRALDEET